MRFVYIIVSIPYPDRYYVGSTENVRQRLGHHNQGIVGSTALYFAFDRSPFPFACYLTA